MPILIHRTCISKFSFITPFVPFVNHSLSSPIFQFAKTPKPHSSICRNICFSCKLPRFRRTHVPLCIKNVVFEEFNDTLLPKRADSEESEELELLLKKPSPNNDEIKEDELEKPDGDEVLEPFYKFLRPFEEDMNPNQISIEEETGKVNVEYYEPKAGDFVVGVVVSGNENKLDVNVGADLLGTMLTKDVLPLYDKDMEYLICDLEEHPEEFLVPGKAAIVKNDEALTGVAMQGRPVVELGTILFAEVLGRTLGGRPLLSTRRLFRRMAWHRVRQVKQLNEPIEVTITEWNTRGLLTRIEGLRAFLPKSELMNRVNNVTELKEKVGQRIHVQITRINEETNNLILSEKEGWEMMNLQHGTLLEGTIKKVFPYGAHIRIGDTNRSGLLHISNITRGKITSVSDLLKVDEQVKVLVVKAVVPGKISLSIAELEREPGLFLSNKEKVFSEAIEMAKRYRQKIAAVPATRKLEALPRDGGLPFGDEEMLYANWKWFEFESERENGINP
ncbi:hypothetical protein OROHE_008946 [Orobanche hederae]